MVVFGVFPPIVSFWKKNRVSTLNLGGKKGGIWGEISFWFFFFKFCKEICLIISSCDRKLVKWWKLSKMIRSFIGKGVKSVI